ncbi:MAG TPA: ATP-binding protein [Candidatus Saccharimonadales bacterium]|nr:ATP-binding protein [Candidatus Saccharimonadales bacterium]
MAPEKIVNTKPEHILSRDDDHIFVVAQEKVLDYDAMVGPDDPMPVVTLGFLPPETQGDLSASVQYAESSSYYSAYGRIDLPDDEMLRGSGFTDDLVDAFSEWENVTVLNDYTLAFNSDEFEDLSIVVGLDRAPSSRRKSSGLVVVPYIGLTKGQGKFTVEQQWLPNDEGVIPQSTVINEMGKIISEVVNYTHIWHKEGQATYYGRMDIIIPVKPGMKSSEDEEQDYSKYPDFHDLGGLENEIALLREFASDMATPAETFAEYGLEKPGGVILIGPGGVGKTEMVRALAKENNAMFEHVLTSDIMSMWVGKSAENLRTLFEDAKTMAAEKGRPALIFFDEFDGLFSNNAGGNAGSAKALISELKNIMSMLQNYPDVWVFAAANSTDNFDPALLRAGRFDVVINVPAPGVEGRRKIFEKYLDRFDWHFNKGVAVDFVGLDEVPVLTIDEALHKAIDPRELAEEAVDFTGADIKVVLQKLLRQKMRLDVANKNAAPEIELPSTTISHEAIIEAIRAHRKSRPADI